MNSYRDERFKREAEQAKSSFERHMIRKESEGRWLLQRTHKDRWDDPDGRWDSTMWTEVICLGGGGLYVGGDISHIIFRYGPEHHEARVFWLGRKPAWDSYVQQKASIGMGGDKHGVSEWNEGAARADLHAFREEVCSYGEGERLQRQLDAVDDAVNAIDMGQNEVCRQLHEEFEEPPEVGMIVTARLIYVMAALHRLCDLLEERRE